MIKFLTVMLTIALTAQTAGAECVVKVIETFGTAQAQALVLKGFTVVAEPGTARMSPDQYTKEYVKAGEYAVFADTHPFVYGFELWRKREDGSYSLIASARSENHFAETLIGLTAPTCATLEDKTQ